jgi:hypothetical protein
MVYTGKEITRMPNNSVKPIASSLELHLEEVSFTDKDGKQKKTYKLFTYLPKPYSIKETYKLYVQVSKQDYKNILDFHRGLL